MASWKKRYHTCIELLAPHAQAAAKFEAAGGWEMKIKVEQVLSGLGFTAADSWITLDMGLIHWIA